MKTNIPQSGNFKRMCKIATSVACIATLSASQFALAHGDHDHGVSDDELTVTTLAEGLVHPWGMAF